MIHWFYFCFSWIFDNIKPCLCSEGQCKFRHCYSSHQQARIWWLTFFWEPGAVGRPAALPSPARFPLLPFPIPGPDLGAAPWSPCRSLHHWSLEGTGDWHGSQRRTRGLRFSPSQVLLCSHSLISHPQLLSDWQPHGLEEPDTGATDLHGQPHHFLFAYGLIL